MPIHYRQDLTSFKKIAAQQLGQFVVQYCKRSYQDPIRGKVLIPCTTPRCSIRWEVSQGTWQFAKQSVQHQDNILALIQEFAEAHEHNQKALGFTSETAWVSFSNQEGYVILCKTCKTISPHPATRPVNWEHLCPKTSKNPHQTPVWADDRFFTTPVQFKFHPKQFWFGPFYFHNLLMQSLNGWGKFSIDDPRQLLCIQDPLMQDFHKTYIALGGGLKWDPKEKDRFQKSSSSSGRSGGLVSIGPKQVAAYNLLSLLPPEMLKRFYRMAIVELHPDKGGDTKKFQDFQQFWAKIGLK